MRAGLLVLGLLALVAPAGAQTTPYVTPLSVEQMQGKQAVVETTGGRFVIDLLPERAPNHVGHFIEQAQQGRYKGTTVHRLIKYGIIQGGDPRSADPSKREQYGTGGLGVLKAEPSEEPMTRGAVAAVLQPGKPDSAGSQFFIAVTDQAALTGQYTVFGRVIEGMEVVQAISEAPADDEGRALDRIEMTAVTIRDAPPPEPVPFAQETAAELAGYRVVLETTRGPITIALDPASAPGHVRNFLRLSALGVYDGTSFHRVVKGFVVQTGMVSTRTTPLTQGQERHVTTLAPEFNPMPHVAGTVSMARLEDPASASTSFFICTAPAPSLDGKYTAFGRVIEGMEIVHQIEQAPLSGEEPVERIELVRAQVVK